MTPAEPIDVLRASGFFRTLSEEELGEIARNGQRIEAGAGSLIVKEGSAAEAFFFLLTGAVQVSSTAGGGDPVVVARLEAGDHFGEQALLPGCSGSRNANVRAVEDSILLRIARADFHRSLAHDPELVKQLSQLGHEQEHSSLLAGSPFFAALAGDDAGSRTRSLQADEVVFRQGSAGEHFYVVLSGSARVEREGPAEPEPLALLGPGQCFGELAILSGEPRAATVVAETDLELLEVQGDRFRALVDSSPELGQLLSTLRKVYRMPGRGLITRHTEEFDGGVAVTTLQQLDDGRSVRATRIVGRDAFHARSSGGPARAEPEQISWRDPKTGITRTLVHADGTALELHTDGPWEELGEAFMRLLEARPFGAEERARLARAGSFKPSGSVPPQADPLVCYCMEVHLSELEHALKEGAETPDELSHATDAGSVCGSCFGDLIELSGNPHWDAATVVEFEQLAPDLLRLALAPRNGAEFAPALAGQHVLVQARVDGTWIQRPYTLTGAEGDTQRRELVIKLEPGGLLSGWLFRNGEPGLPMRLSPPRGDFVLDPTASRAALFLAAGVGITPALSLVRSLRQIGEGRSLHLDWSARSGHFCSQELEEAASSLPGLSVRLRATEQGERLDPAGLSQLLEEHAGAELFACGPPAFGDDVRSALRARGVDPRELREELFTPQAGPGAIG